MEPGYEMCVSPCVYGNEEVRKEILAECFVRELVQRYFEKLQGTCL